MFSQPSTNSELNQYQVYPWRKLRTKWFRRKPNLGYFCIARTSKKHNFEEAFANFVELTMESFFFCKDIGHYNMHLLCCASQSCDVQAIANIS
jgi:hypothetical protein